MELNKNDFIEIEFTGKIKDGDIFDSNIEEDMKKLHEGHNHKIDAKPFGFCLGHGMFLKSLDNFLIGKPEKVEEYNVELQPEDAFGQRDSGLIKMMPLKVFREHQINPVPGIMFNFDGNVGKVLTSSGGRVIVDFNSSLAGKIVEYKIKFLRKINDINEKINILNDFFFRKHLKFEIKDKKLIFEVDKQMKLLLDLLQNKYKEMLDLEVEVKETEEKE